MQLDYGRWLLFEIADLLARHPGVLRPETASATRVLRGLGEEPWLG
ncbi:MAG: hypothetical protein K9N23_01915 [Akkermansiaceae bacterium]|nr:hypothetical protein [Akkermansiaceae bacterium]MCF7730407.1 hypothetical protein [Akkermansiaceae bacterium]